MMAPLVGNVTVLLVVGSLMLARLCEPGVVPIHRKYPLTPEPAVQLKVVDAEVSVLPLAGLVMVAAATVYWV